MTDFQPTLPLEQPFTEAEIAFMEESPPGLYPENQNSNFGYLIRRIWCNQIQQAADQLATMFSERFISSSTLLLDDWELDLGLPVASGTLTTAQRRTNLFARKRTGGWTTALRNGIIEDYIRATFGTVIEFVTAGIPFVAGGIPFFSEAGDVSTLYAVVEDLANFTYEVRIKNTITPDEAGLRRALDYVTPAGYSYTIVYVATP